MNIISSESEQNERIPYANAGAAKRQRTEPCDKCKEDFLQIQIFLASLHERSTIKVHFKRFNGIQLKKMFKFINVEIIVQISREGTQSTPQTLPAITMRTRNARARR